jgi:hypothetical protein
MSCCKGNYPCPCCEKYPPQSFEWLYEQAKKKHDLKGMFAAASRIDQYEEIYESAVAWENFELAAFCLEEIEVKAKISEVLNHLTTWQPLVPVRAHDLVGRASGLLGLLRGRRLNQ